MNNKSDQSMDDSQDNGKLNLSFDSLTSKRGRPLIQDQWTRIVHVTESTDSWIKIYVIASELLLEGHLPNVSR